MPWIDDVVPYSTILSAWGNNIRNHAPAIYTDINDRNTNASKMAEGQLCYTVAEKALFVRRVSAANGFGTLFMDWTNYTIGYQLDNAFPSNITQTVGKWRRIGARTVQAQFAFQINSNYGAGQHALIWSLPVTALTLDLPIGSGEGFESTKYAAGPIKTYNADGNWATIMDQNTRQMFVPQSGTPIVRGSVLYDVADG